VGWIATYSPFASYKIQVSAEGEDRRTNHHPAHLPV